MSRKKENPAKALLEVIEQPWQEAESDRENLLLRNICVLGPQSRNGRRYPEEAITEALPMFDGCKAYLNHPAPAELREGSCRDVRDLVGRYESPRLQEGKLRADLRLLPHQANLIFSLAKYMPSAVGMSINAKGKTCVKDGEEFVEKITEVKSVDLVTEPAATTSLFESILTSMKEEMNDLREITEDALRHERPDLVEAIEKPLLEKLEEHRAKEQNERRREVVLEKIGKAKIPSDAVTETFIKTVMEAKDERELTALIEDRAKLVRDAKSFPQAREKSSARNGISDREMYGTSS